MRIIAGSLKGRTIKTLKGLIYRPATARIREAIFSILGSYNLDWEKAFVIDFFAGSGSLGIEALSRGAKEVWFVDKDRRAINVIKENLTNFNISKERFRLICADVFSFLKKKNFKKFDLIFIDPPYRKGLLKKFLKDLLKSDLLANDCLIFAEVEKELIDVSSEKLKVLTNKTYGQTRLYLWKVTL